MSKKSNPHDGIIIPSVGDSVKSLQDTIAGMARHKTLAEDIQLALADYYMAQGQIDKAHWLPLCGSWLRWRIYNDPDNTSQLVAANYCRHQLCPVCAWRKHAKYGAVLSRALEGMDSLYLVTMTVDNTPQITRERLQQIIQQSTAMLRVLNCKDYVANIEITYSDEKGYHPHVHAIVYQPYWTSWDIGRNMAFWRKKWGTKMDGIHGYNILHIAPITDTVGAIAEVTKYLCKPMSKSDNIIPAIKHMIPAVRRVRQIRAGGIIRKKIITAKSELMAEKMDDMKRLQNYDWYTVVSQWIAGDYVTHDPSRVGVEILRQQNTTRP